MAGYIGRSIQSEIEESLADYPVVALLGPRQVGKSTLTKEQLEVESKVYLDLELGSDLRKLNEPELYFERHTDELICIDEIQRFPELFPTIRGTVDQFKKMPSFSF